MPNLSTTLVDGIPNGVGVGPDGLGEGAIAQDNALVWTIPLSSTVQTRVFTATVSVTPSSGTGHIEHVLPSTMPNRSVTW